jgi:hypothetical protein
MNSGSIGGQSQSFRDDKEICRRAEMILLDHQARSDASGFQQNSETGKRMHGLLGWNKLMPESMALYQAGRPTFRKASKPAAEARLWIEEGIAGGIQPWWHHVGAAQEDRRQFHTIEGLNRWHEKHERFLIEREPVAAVGVLWSRQNADYFGRDHVEELVEAPYRGIINALVRGRIPYLPVHIDHLSRDGNNLAAVILPNFGGMSDTHARAVRDFVGRGGGDSSLFDEWGEPRTDFALADLFGVHRPAERKVAAEVVRARQAGETLHTYLRLQANAASRHPVLRGFEETDILPFGGHLEELLIDKNATVPLTFVPPFPIYPPETSWMREPKSNIPGLVLNESSRGGRVAYLPADLDRRFARDNLPDHGDLLANLIRWTAGDKMPFEIEGAGLIDCQLYRQQDRLILHLVNLTNAGTWRQPVHELIPIGPLTIRVKLPDGGRAQKVQLLVSEQQPAVVVHDQWIVFSLTSVLDHEVVVVG